MRPRLPYISNRWKAAGRGPMALAQRNHTTPFGDYIMKKIAITLAAIASLGVAACGSNNDAGNNVTDINTTVTETETDVNASANDAAAIDATNSALGNTVDAGSNLASDAGNSIENGASALSNSVTNAAQ